MSRLILDLELLVYSYLELEETLILLYFDKSKKDKVIRLYYRGFIDINTTIIKNQLYTLKYLIDIGVIPTIANTHLAISKKNTKFVKLLLDKAPVDEQIIGRILSYGDGELLRLAVTKIKLNPSFIEYLIFLYGPCEAMIEYLRSLAHKDIKI